MSNSPQLKIAKYLVKETTEQFPNKFLNNLRLGS